jgi:hypothetical protein
LALARSVYAFQKLEWLTTCMLALVTDGDIDKCYGLTFGTLVSRLRKRLREEPSVGKGRTAPAPTLDPAFPGDSPPEKQGR